MFKIDSQNDGFGPPKASQNDPKIESKSDQKSMQKTKRKKNRHKTKITPSEVQKSLKNLRKINKNQKITYSKFDPIWPPKTTQNRTPKRPKNEPKKITKKERKKERKKKPTCLKNDPNMAPQNDPKTNKKQHQKTTQKNNAKMTKKPDPAVNGKRRLQTLFVIYKRFCYVFAAYYFYLISFLMYLYVLPVPKNNVQKKE